MASERDRALRELLAFYLERPVAPLLGELTEQRLVSAAATAYVAVADKLLPPVGAPLRRVATGRADRRPFTVIGGQW